MNRTTYRSTINPFLFRMTLGIAGSVLLPGAALAADAPTSTDIIYVETNDGRANQNAVAAYRRDASGNLTALPGSPYLTGGTGYPGFRDTDQNVVVNADQSLLFAVNEGSDTIAVMHINPDQTLTPVAGSPFHSGGVRPVSVGVAGNRLYVVNNFMSSIFPAPNYTGFQIESNGALTPIPGSTQSVAPNAWPTQALTTAQGDFLFGADFSAGNMQAFKIAGDGTLQQSPNTPLYVTDAPLGASVHPTQPVVYVGYPFARQLGVFTYDNDGTLTVLPRASNSGSAICWLGITRDGKNMYSTNTGDRSISWYDLTTPTIPVERQHFVISSGPLQIAANAPGTYVYTVALNGTLHTLRIGFDGSVSEPISPVTVATGNATPQGVAIVQPPTAISGQIHLQSASPSSAGQALTLQFRPTDHSASFTKQVTLGTSGTFTLNGIPPLAYDVWVKGSKWLADVITLDTRLGNVSGVNVNLAGGDANNDNKVDIADFALFVSAYGTTLDSTGFDTRTDFNEDGSVDIADFGLLVNSYGTQGHL